MEVLPSPPRPRSLPVVVLDTITQVVVAVRRPFRSGRLPAAQQITIGIAVGIVMIGATVLSLGVQWRSSDPAGAPHRAAAGGTPTADPGPGTGTPPPTWAESAPSGTASGPASSLAATTSGAAAPSGRTGPQYTGTGGRAEPLQARFSKVAGSASLTSYRATLTVTNPGQEVVSSWTVIITLPRETLTLSNVEGATAGRNSTTWTIVPTADTTSVTAGGSVSVSFQVNGAAVFDATPTACTIDGQACTGLGG
jgi:hypothetical protein